MPMRTIPTPKYEEDIKRLINYYQKAFNDIAKELKTIQSGIEQQQAVSLLNQIAFILETLDVDTRGWVEQVITRSFKQGQVGTIFAIDDARTLAEAASLASFSMLARNTVEALINDTYTDLLMATQNTERKVKQLVQRVVSDTLRLRAVEQLGRRTVRNEIVDKLTQKGLSRTLEKEGWVGIVDKTGRHWNLSTYAEMVVRTNLQQAHIEGARVESLERGVDLAIVSTHGAKDACRAYEGLVISMNSISKGFST